MPACKSMLLPSLRTSSTPVTAQLGLGALMASMTSAPCNLLPFLAAMDSRMASISAFLLGGGGELLLGGGGLGGGGVFFALISSTAWAAAACHIQTSCKLSSTLACKEPSAPARRSAGKQACIRPVSKLSTWVQPEHDLMPAALLLAVLCRPCKRAHASMQRHCREAQHHAQHSSGWAH